MMTQYIKLLRINHWFKNFFVVIGAACAYLFVLYTRQSLSTLAEYAILILGAFLLASLISSVNYVINQITDVQFDKKHPTKKNRPLPSGKVSIEKAFIISMIIFGLCFVVSLKYYSLNFTALLVSLWIAGIIYNVKPIRAKDIPFVDVVVESANNPIRFSMGWFVITNIMPRIDILVVTWTAGAILMTAKRYDEYLHFGDNLVPYRATFSRYSLLSLKRMLYVYSFLTLFVLGLLLSSIGNIFLFTLWPLFLLFIAWILRQVITGNAKTRSAESFVLTKKFITFSLFILFVVIILIINKW